MEVMDRDFFSYFSHHGSCCVEVATSGLSRGCLVFCPVTGRGMLIYYLGSRFSTISRFLLEKLAGNIGHWWSKTVVVRTMKSCHL